MYVVEHFFILHKMVLPFPDFISEIFKAWFEVHFPTLLITQTLARDSVVGIAPRYAT
jgi:hypothetical protein